MKKFFLLPVFLMVFFYLHGQFVNSNDAELVAKNHFYQAFNSMYSEDEIAYKNILATCILNPAKDNTNYYYVFNINEDKGFVLVSSQKTVKPILAYSLTSGFNTEVQPVGQTWFLDHFNRSIKLASENKIEPREDVAKEWNRLLNFQKSNFKELETAGPLFGAIMWNQSWPYNAHSPKDPESNSGHVPVGCVATSMLQIMKFYNWPKTGEGEVFHTSWANGGYGDYHIVFSEHTYDWSSIPNTATGRYNPELAEVNLHGSVAVRVSWGPFGTASQTMRVGQALKNYFKYSPELSLQQKANYEFEDWKALLRDQVDNNLPMVYSGFGTDSEGNPSGGHAWNCDGYQGEDHFHMNWGWGGAGDGFYTLDDLVSTATSGGSQYNFVHSQQAIIDIYPKGDFPIYCSGSTYITGAEGSFDDGSSKSDYPENADCRFVIQPDCGDVIELKFNRFNLAEGDYVKIYSGSENPANLIAELDSNNIPDETFITNTGRMTLRFRSNNDNTDMGWKAEYKVYYCKMNLPFSDTYGAFGDGSGKCNYENSTVCTWRINPDGAQNIIIRFDEFDLGDNVDYVKVFKNSMSSNNMVAELTKNNPPTENIHIDSNLAILQFFTGPGETGKGWEISYFTDISNVEGSIVNDKIAIYPNPGQNNAEISINAVDFGNAAINIYDVAGKKIGAEVVEISAGNNVFKILDLVDKPMQSGVYFVNIELGNANYSERFIFIE